MNKYEPSFSLYEFRKWLDHHELPNLGSEKKSEEAKQEYNYTVESRLGISRLETQITQHNSSLSENEVKKIAKQFKENKGKLIDVQDLMSIVEVNSTVIKLPSSYTKKSS